MKDELTVFLPTRGDIRVEFTGENLTKQEWYPTCKKISYTT